MTNVAARFRFPFDGCSDTVKSRLPVHFALPSFSLPAGERGDEGHDPLPPLLLLFALYSSTFPALTLGEFFSIRVAGRVRVGPILLSLSLSLRGYANSLEALRESSFLSRETSDRFFSFFPSSFLQVDFRRGIVTSEKSSIDRFTSYHFCRNLARTSRRFRRVHEHRRSINAGVSKHGKPTNRIPSPRRQENFYDYR